MFFLTILEPLWMSLTITYSKERLLLQYGTFKILKKKEVKYGNLEQRGDLIEFYLQSS